VTRTAAGTRFDQPDGQAGAKWSRALPEAIRGARWVALRYRAKGLASHSDYALYVAASAGGKSEREQYLVKFSDLVADGSWHVARARLQVDSVQTLAVQVQAARPEAFLEVGSLTFSDRKPAIELQQVLDYRRGFPAAMAGWRPLALPPGNLDGPGLSRLFEQEGWLDGEQVTVQQVPFRVRPGRDAVIITPVRDVQDIQVPLTGQGAELYLLLATLLPASEEASYSHGLAGATSLVHRFVARIEYADGGSDEQFPYSLASGGHRLARGVGAYALALSPGRPLRQLVLRDRYRRGALGLIAATLAAQPGPATVATQLKPAVPLPRPLPVEARQASVGRVGDRVIAASHSFTLVLDLSRGLQVASVENHAAVRAPLVAKPGPLFSLDVAGRKVTAAEFKVAAVSSEPSVCRIVLEHELAKVEVTVDVTGGAEVGLRASCRLNGGDPRRSRFTFPELSGLSFSDNADDNWYWMPRQGDVVSNQPALIRARYAGAGNPAQVFGTFSPRAGTGLYVMTQDLDALPRHYLLTKRGGSVSLAVEYQPLFRAELPRTVIGCHQGGWQAQLQRYREWVSTWYREAAPRKSWFREVFNFRQQFLHFDLPVKSGMFDAKTKAWRLKEVVDEDAQAFGGVDYLHLFDWGWDPVRGRCGDYLPWDYLGGAEPFRKAIAGVKDAGVPVGLYIEGYLIDPPAAVSKAHGAEWQLLNADGKPYTNFAPSFHVCPAVKAWQDYLSSTYARAKRETGAVGFYIDEFGFTSFYDCYNPAHGHPVPQTPVLGEREMLRRVREALGPETVIYTEESPTDVNSQFQDGSFTYNISSVSDDLSPTHLNLYRFLFPSFKTIEIVVCDKPLGDNVEAVRQVLFSGEAIWIEGIANRWFTPETRAAIAVGRKVMRANRECFAGDYPTPLVPTRFEGLYANRFASQPDERGKTCWTVYNTTYRTARGGLIAVKHFPGAKYRDELTGRELTVKVEGDEAVLDLTIGPREVTVVSRVVE